MRLIARKHVRLATPEEHQRRRHGGGGRAGTIHATLEGFARKFGDPHETFTPENSDGKVTAEWYFMTPRGLISVYDYWWNPPGALSIGLRNSIDPDSPTGSLWLKEFGSWGDRRAVLWARRQ